MAGRASRSNITVATGVAYNSLTKNLKRNMGEGGMKSEQEKKQAQQSKEEKSTQAGNPDNTENANEEGPDE